MHYQIRVNERASYDGDIGFAVVYVPEGLAAQVVEARRYLATLPANQFGHVTIYGCLGVDLLAQSEALFDGEDPDEPVPCDPVPGDRECRRTELAGITIGLDWAEVTFRVKHCDNEWAGDFRSLFATP